MSDKMLKFVTTTDKEMPEKRGAGDRVADFDEIYNEFDVASAETQASRCSQCGVPFCQINCPLHNNIPDWLMLTAEGGWKRPTNCQPRPITCRKFAAAFARRIGCAKAVV